MQCVNAKQVAQRLLILDAEGSILYYRGEGHGDRLGPLAKQICIMLFHEALTGAEIARRLNTWHNHVHISLGKLARKGLVNSRVAIGENLAKSKVLRKFYTLNPEKVAIAIPVPSPTIIQLQQAKEKAQTEALERERNGIRLMRELSPNPLTRCKTPPI